MQAILKSYIFVSMLPVQDMHTLFNVSLLAPLQGSLSSGTTSLVPVRSSILPKSETQSRSISSWMLSDDYISAAYANFATVLAI